MIFGIELEKELDEYIMIVARLRTDNERFGVLYYLADGNLAVEIPPSY